MRVGLHRGFLFILLIGAMAGPSVGAGAEQASLPSQSVPALNVRDFGAKGDGHADDTFAFQTSMNECLRRGGGVVSVPAGRYLIVTHLTVPSSVTLEGTWRAPQPTAWAGGIMPASPEMRGSILLAVEGAGKPDGAPFITLNVGATLKGVTIYYPNQSTSRPAVAYPWTVRNAGSDAAIVDVLMMNPYQAVDFGTNPSARHFIHNLYADPLYKGIYVDQCIDIGRIENVHFWPFWSLGLDIDKSKMEQGQAFILGRADWEYISNSFAYSYKTGFRFVNGAGTGFMAGAGNYLLTQTGADGCPTAILVESTQEHSGISFSNSQIFGSIVVKGGNQGLVRFNGCNIFGAVDEQSTIPTAELAGTGTTIFANCQLNLIYPLVRGDSVIHVKSGHLIVSGCVFMQSESSQAYILPVIKLDPLVRSAVITGNEFRGRAEVANRSKGRVVIANNVEETEQLGQSGTIPIAEIRPGTETVELLPGGDFSGPSAEKHWTKWGDAFVGASPVKSWKSGVACVRPGVLKTPNGGYQRKVRLKPNTEYVLSGYIWNFSKGPGERVIAHIDMNYVPGEAHVRISPYRAGARNGFFVYRTFSTATTGAEIDLRLYFNLPTDYRDPKTIAAMWDNIAITPASKFRPPIPKRRTSLR